MMLSSGHLVSALDVSTATFTLTVFCGGAALAVFAILVIYLIRRAGLAGMVGMLSSAGLVLVGAMLAAVLLVRDQAAARRTLELRSAELTAHAIAPGSALACLNGVTSVVETACEKALFATPEAVASAVAYVDARLSLLAASAAVANYDKSYRPAFERLRRSLEADRFGLVAHVLTTRGCSPTDCADLALLHDTERIVANMKAQVFESQVGVHALAWQPNGANVAASPAPSTASSSLTASSMTGLSPMPAAPTTSGGPAGKFEYPSAASIPPVSIMSAEPGSPPSAETKPAPVPRRAVRHAAPKPPVQAAAPPPPPPPPLNTAPPAQQEAAPPEPPQISGLSDRSAVH